MVPKIIHQFWIGSKRCPTELMNSWRFHNPDWEYMFWDEGLLKQEFPDGLTNQLQYDYMPELNGKCDIARYEILKRYGGFFVDADAMCLCPIDNYLLDNEMFACYENEFARPGLIATGYIGSIAGSSLLDELIRRIGKMSEKEVWTHFPSALETVGPVFSTMAIHEIPYTSISVYPSYYFIPEHYTGVKYTGAGKIRNAVLGQYSEARLRL